MEVKPKYKKCDKVWFVRPNGKIYNEMIFNVSKVVMKQEDLKSGRIMKCEMFLYDFDRPRCSLYEEDLFSTKEELMKYLEEEQK